MTLQPLRCAVIGVGYLGKFHAAKYQQLSHAKLIAVCDASEETAKAVAQERNVPYFLDYQELIGKVDAVSIVTPTHSHFHIAKSCLEHGIHVLLEKPMTSDLTQAALLVKLAQEKKCKLQIGHVERFNGALLAVQKHLSIPRFIESHRLAPFYPRGKDVNVVFDLMIHDIDIIQSLVDSPVVHIEASGTPILGKDIDIANARIQFASGCIANVTASRISFKSERKLRIFQENAYLSLDLQNKHYAIYHKEPGKELTSLAEIQYTHGQASEQDALQNEINSFVHAIIENKPPTVSGEQGLAALSVALDITQKIETGLQQVRAQTSQVASASDLHSTNIS